MRFHLLSMLPLAALSAMATAQTPPAAVVGDNARLTAMFDADQAARQPGVAIDWAKLSLEDEKHRAGVAAMLKAGSVRTGLDYWHAAFIFQHGDGPRDYLLAHTLAVTSVAQGYAKAGWIAAATLDRYLGTIGQPQIYGTQYLSKPGNETTQEPYDRTLLTDQQRQAVKVPTLAEQGERLKAMEAERAASTPPR